MDFLGSGGGLLLAALGIGFVIFIHELGHYLFAKWAGVRVFTFSIGFGPVILRKTIGETDYVLSILPFGGYVAMQEKKDQVKDSEPGRSMEEVHPWWQAAILFAGVLFNLISSYILLLCLAWYGMPHFPPVVGQVSPTLQADNGEFYQSPASELGLLPGDRIITYNGKEIMSYQDLIYAPLEFSGEPVKLEIERHGQEMILPPEGAEEVFAGRDAQQGRARLGLIPAAGNRIAAIAGQEVEGLETGWRVVKVGERDTTGQYHFEFEDELWRNVGEQLPLRLEKDGEFRDVTITYDGHSFTGPIGLPVVIREVTPGFPAEAAGLRAGDVCVGVNGTQVSSSDHFISLIRRHAEAPITLAFKRRGPEGWQDHEVQLETKMDADHGRPLVGVVTSQPVLGRLPVLPPALGKDSNPLADAGIKAGDSLLHLESLPKDGKGGDTSADMNYIVRYLRGGETVTLPFDKDGWGALGASREPSVFAKFLGARAPKAIVRRLIGSEILLVDEENTLLRIRRWPTAKDSTEAAKEEAVALHSLPEAAQKQLLSLKVGDWLVGEVFQTEADGTGSVKCLEVLRGPETDGGKPFGAEVAVAYTGTVMRFQPEEVPYELESWTDAFGLAAWRSWDMVAQTGRIISLFFASKEDGGVDASKTLHGPIGIFSELKARHDLLGFASFLKIVALLGLNLFLINLLPIPIADGGRLLIVGIEQIIRRPVPDRIIDNINRVGFVAIVLLMLFVVGVDVLRLMGAH